MGDKNGTLLDSYGMSNLILNIFKVLNGEIDKKEKICKNCEKKEIEDEIHIIFSCNKYDNIWRKTFNDINKVDNIKLQIGNKVEKLKRFFGEGSWKAFNIFG